METCNPTRTPISQDVSADPVQGLFASAPHARTKAAESSSLQRSPNSLTANVTVIACLLNAIVLFFFFI